MKSKKVVEKCLEEFDENQCQLAKGHFGKHRDDRDGRWSSWTDAGAKRVLAEREREQVEQKK